MKGSGNQMKKSTGLLVDDYFISACDKKNTTMNQEQKSDQTEQPHSMFFFLVTEEANLETSKHKKDI